MKKLMFVLGFLLIASTSMAEDARGLVEVCGEKVDRVETEDLDGLSRVDLKSTVADAVRAGQPVKICAVGSLPVAILKIQSGRDQTIRIARFFIPELD